MCDGQADPKLKFTTLAQNKNIVVLSKAQIGKRCQAMFLHSVVGCPINPEELRYVARSGMKSGAGVELDPDTSTDSEGTNEGKYNHRSRKS